MRDYCGQLRNPEVTDLESIATYLNNNKRHGLFSYLYLQMEEHEIPVGESISKPSHKRKRQKLSLDDALKEVEAAATALEESYRLTDLQEKAIQKCFEFLKTNPTVLEESVRRQKNSAVMTTYRMLHDVRFLLGLKPFLLCTLALAPTKMQTMAKLDAAKFPSKLQTWWKSWESSTKLDALASQYKLVDGSISYVTPDVQLCEPHVPSGRLLHERRRTSEGSPRDTATEPDRNPIGNPHCSLETHQDDFST